MTTRPLYLIDEENVTFKPSNVNEAIILFNRMKRKNQIHWDYVPELLQKLSSGLNDADHDLFCEWICNPCAIKPGDPGYFSELCAPTKEETDMVSAEEKLDCDEEKTDVSGNPE